MRRGLKARLSKELDSSKAGKDEPEKYQIRIPGRGTPNKHVKENVIESSNSKKEKEDSVRTASFTMEQEIEIKNNDKKNDDQTPSSSRRKRCCRTSGMKSRTWLWKSLPRWSSGKSALGITTALWMNSSGTLVRTIDGIRQRIRRRAVRPVR